MIKKDRIKNEWEIAKDNAGYRERYAMTHGNRTISVDHRGHTMWKFKYSADDEYQDANGALYDATEKRWVN